MAISDKGGNVVYRFVYDTYGELSDIQNGNKVSLKTAEEASEYTPAELADAAGIEYLYNGRYGVTTDSNGLYYMRARYYDQDIKRFINRDVLSGDITNSQSLNRYCYVQGNPVSLTDPFGLCPTAEEIARIRLRSAVHTSLDITGLLFDGADVLNAIVYAIEGDNVDAAWSLFFTIPVVGSVIGLPFKYAFKLGGNAAEGLAKFTKKNAPELAEGFGKLKRNVGGKLDDAGEWIQKKLGKAGAKEEFLTGTVWDSINPTQPNIRGTEIPQSFEIMVDDATFWVHPNGTKHMGEYITRNAMSHGMPMNSQALLTSFQNAVNIAYAEGIRYEQIMKVGDWELIFSRPRTEGLLPVIKHALYIP